MLDVFPFGGPGPAGTIPWQQGQEAAPQFLVRRWPKPRPGQEPWVFYTAERSNENQSGLSAAVRQPQKNPIPYKASRRAQIQPREIPQSGVNSRIPEFESRCTGVPKCRPSEK